MNKAKTSKLPKLTLAPFSPRTGTNTPTTQSEKCQLFSKEFEAAVGSGVHLDLFFPFEEDVLKTHYGAKRLANMKDFSSSSTLIEQIVSLGLTKFNLPPFAQKAGNVLVDILKTAAYGSQFIETILQQIPNPIAPKALYCFEQAGFGSYNFADRESLISECQTAMNLKSNMDYAMLYYTAPTYFFGCDTGAEPACETPADFITVCLAFSLCPETYYVYVNNQVLGCLIPELEILGTNAGITIGYSPEAAIGVTTTYYDFVNEVTQTLPSLGFNLEIVLDVSLPVEPGTFIGRLFQCKGLVTLAIAGTEFDPNPQNTYQNTMLGQSSNMMLLQGESDLVVAFETFTAGILTNLAIPLKEIAILVNGADVQVSNSNNQLLTLYRGVHFYYGPAVQNQASTFTTFFQTFLLRFGNLVGSALDMVGLHNDVAIFKQDLSVVSYIISQIANDAQSRFNSKTIAVHYDFASQVQISLTAAINLNIGSFAVDGNFGLQCTIMGQNGGKPSFSCSVVLPGVNQITAEIINDVDGWIVKTENTIVAAALNGVVSAIDSAEAFTKKSYQDAVIAVQKGTSTMIQLAEDAVAQAEGLFVCGTGFQSKSLECNFQNAFNFPTCNSIGSCLQDISIFTQIPGDIANLATDLDNCVTNAFTTLYTDVKNAVSSIGLQCTNNQGNCLTSLCIPFLQSKGNNCCCGIGSLCFSNNCPCGYTFDQCYWNPCLIYQPEINCKFAIPC